MLVQISATRALKGLGRDQDAERNSWSKRSWTMNSSIRIVSVTSERVTDISIRPKEIAASGTPRRR